MQLPAARTLWRVHWDLVDAAQSGGHSGSRAEEEPEQYARALRGDYAAGEISHGTCDEYLCPICDEKRETIAQT
jgi:hypothetical protein